MPKHRSKYVRQFGPDRKHTQWSALRKHSRFVSEWEDDIVVINIAHKNDKAPKLRSYHLAEIFLAASGGDSIHDRRVPLKRYPHLIYALKAAINETLHVRTSSVGDAVTNTLNHVVRFYVWMMRRGVYRLSQLTSQDTEDFANEWCEQGWWYLGGYDRALEAVLEEARVNQGFAETLIGTSNSGRISIKAEVISSTIGLPLSANFIPTYFIVELAKILHLQKPIGLRKPRSPVVSSGTFAECMVEINKLSLIPGAVDSIPRRPYHAPSDLAAARFPNDKGRTANIKLDDAIKIFVHAVNVVFELGPAVVELAKVARAALEYAIQSQRTDSGVVTRALTKAAPEISARYGLVLGETKLFTGQDLRDLISKVQVGAFCLIAANHGRRRNEIIGHDVPHGLYFGCVRLVGDSSIHYKIDIYIAKSLQRYTEFWCNKLVHNTVLLLEELAQQFRPLYTEPKSYHPMQSESRGDKLFISRAFTTIGFRRAPQVLDFGRKADDFFKEIELSPSYVSERAHPFRRIFVQIYKRRYDHPVLLAMHQHLCHEHLGSTRTYMNDPDGRKDAESAAILYRKDDLEVKGFREVIAEVDKEYFEEKILKLLKGEETGGIFPRIVLQLMQRLSKNTTFVRAPLAVKAKITREKLEANGYKANETEHGVCFAGTASKTRGRSNCFSHGETHPELATPAACDGCTHMLTNSNYHQSIYKVRDALLVDVKNYALPKVVRLSKQKEAEFLTQYVEKDIKVAEQNQIAVAKLVASWERIVVSEERFQ